MKICLATKIYLTQILVLPWFALGKGKVTIQHTSNLV